MIKSNLFINVVLILAIQVLSPNAGSLLKAQITNPDLVHKKKVFILGTFHFASNADIIKHNLENMLSEKRQKEIEQVVIQLSEFKPDKICIEWDAGEDQPFTDSVYGEYLNDKFTLKANEVYQIAFRLAKKLGHKKVYCIDAPGNFLHDTLVSTAKKYNQSDWFDRHFHAVLKVAESEDSLRTINTLKENLRKINSKAALQFGLDVNDVFISPLLGKPGEYAGAEFLGEWYKRNIRMYSNVLRVAEAKDKRIFVLVGASHKSIMKQLFETNPQWELVDVIDYLK